MCHETKLNPESCFHRYDVDPSACSQVQAAAVNGEGPEACCRACPIADPECCPELDDLSARTLAFSGMWDHEAHEGYREALWEVIAPALTPGDVPGFLVRRQIIWNTMAQLQKEDSEKAEKERAGNGGSTTT